MRFAKCALAAFFLMTAAAVQAQVLVDSNDSTTNNISANTTTEDNTDMRPALLASGGTRSQQVYNASPRSVVSSPPPITPTSLFPVATPEPGSLALLIGLGISGAGFLIRRRKKSR